MKLDIFVEGKPRPQGSVRHRSYWMKDIYDSSGQVKEDYVDAFRAGALRPYDVMKTVIQTVTKGLEEWRGKIAKEVSEAYEGNQMQGAVKVSLEFHMKRPKRHYCYSDPGSKLISSAPRYCIRGCDLDKLERAVFDALTQSKVIKDDKLICAGYRKKIYSNEHKEGVRIIMEEIKQ